MTNEEVTKIEKWVEYSVHELTDRPTEFRIRFCPEIALRDTHSNELSMRTCLASYLRRIAAHLEA